MECKSKVLEVIGCILSHEKLSSLKSLKKVNSVGRTVKKRKEKEKTHRLNIETWTSMLVLVFSWDLLSIRKL